MSCVLCGWRKTEEFLKALREEASANAEFFGDAEAAPDTGVKDFRDTVTAVRSSDGAYNWALFGADAK